MGSYLNLIGSIIIGGLLLITVNEFHSSITQRSYESTLDSITIRSASAISKLIEYDFNKMGLGVSFTNTAVVLADSDRITFLADINNSGAVDSIRYFLSDTSDVSGTDNPRDKILYRLVNNEAQKDAAMGVTDFKLRYFNAAGNLTTTLADIKSFEITLTVESTFPYDDRYSQFYWQTKITPPNLMRY